MAKTAKNDSIKSLAYRNLSWSYAITRIKLDSARLYADSVKMISKENNDTKGINLAHFYYGVIDRFEGNYESALEHLNLFVAYQLEHENIHREASGLFQIGAVQSDLGNYDESLEAFQRVAAIHENNEYWYGVGFNLYSIGNIYRKIGNQTDAIFYYEKAMAVLDTLSYEEDKANVLTNLGNSYEELNDLQKSLKFHERALKIYKELDLSDAIANSHGNIGTVYRKMSDYNTALAYQLEALRIFEKGPNKSQIASAYKKIGYTYLKKNDLQLAEEYLGKSLTLSQSLGAKPIILENYEYLALLYESKNDIRKALKFQKLWSSTKDSILNEESVKQINLLTTKYETAEKEKAIALLTTEKEIQEKEARRKATMTNAIIGGLAFTLLLAGLLFYTFRQRVRNQRLLTQKNAEITEVNYKQQLSDLEMKALRAQMNPHFVFNCLNSINRMILGGDIKDASSYLTKFSRLIRKVLENSEKNMVSLADELTMLKAYIQLESLRFKGKITYKTEIDKNLNLDDTFIPSMVLQPLIENAIWHGLMHKEKGGTIMLSIAKADNVLKCSVEDDGVGREKTAAIKDGSHLKEKSMGLQLTSERLKIMGQLGLKRFINIIDLKDEDDRAIGTRVDLLIPIA